MYVIKWGNNIILYIPEPKQNDRNLTVQPSIFSRYAVVDTIELAEI